MTDENIPPEETERRRRVLSCVDDIRDLQKDLAERTVEIQELGVTPEEMCQLLGIDAADPRIVVFLRALTAEEEPPPAKSDYPPSGLSTEAERTKGVLERLFHEAPKLENPDGSPRTDQAPALECAVVLKTGTVQLHGALSTTPEGTLRMLVPTPMQDNPRSPPRTVLVEHFFDYEQIADIAIIREMKPVEPSRIVTRS